MSFGPDCAFGPNPAIGTFEPLIEGPRITISRRMYSAVAFKSGGPLMTKHMTTIRRLETADLEAFRRVRLEALLCEPASFTSTYRD